MTFLRALAGVLFVVALPVAIILTVVRVAFNEQAVYQYSIDTFDAPGVTGFSRGQLLQAAVEIRHYLNSSDPVLRVLVSDASGQRVPLFKTREVEHMADVKTLLQRVYLLQSVALGFVLAYVVAAFGWAREGSIRQLARAVAWSASLTAALVVALGAALAVGFDRLFTEFHVLAFSNNLWELDPARDHLVQIFPQEFWYQATLGIGVVSVAVALALLGLSAFYLGRTRPRHAMIAATEEEQPLGEAMPVRESAAEPAGDGPVAAPGPPDDLASPALSTEEADQREAAELPGPTQAEAPPVEEPVAEEPAPAPPDVLPEAPAAEDAAVPSVDAVEPPAEGAAAEGDEEHEEHPGDETPHDAREATVVNQPESDDTATG